MTVFEPLRLPPVSGHVHRVARRRGAVWYVKYRMPDPTRPGRVRQVRKMLGPEWPEKGPPPPGYYDRRSAQEALEAVLTDARRGAIELSRTGVTFEQAAIEKRTRLGERQLSEATRDPLASPVDTERIDTVGAPSRTGRAPTSIRTSSDHARKNGRGSRVFLAARARGPQGH